MEQRREEMKAKFLAEAEMLYDEMMKWEEGNPEPDFTQIEEIVLKLRKRMGEGMAKMLIERQASKQPVPGPSCRKCGKEMRNKGIKGREVESRIGVIEMERGYYVCPECGEKIFPPG